MWGLECANKGDADVLGLFVGKVVAEDDVGIPSRLSPLAPKVTGNISSRDRGLSMYCSNNDIGLQIDGCITFVEYDNPSTTDYVLITDTGFSVGRIFICSSVNLLLYLFI